MGCQFKTFGVFRWVVAIMVVQNNPSEIRRSYIATFSLEPLFPKGVISFLGVLKGNDSFQPSQRLCVGGLSDEKLEMGKLLKIWQSQPSMQIKKLWKQTEGHCRWGEECRYLHKKAPGPEIKNTRCKQAHTSAVSWTLSWLFCSLSRLYYWYMILYEACDEALTLNRWTGEQIHHASGFGMAFLVIISIIPRDEFTDLSSLQTVSSWELLTNRCFLKMMDLGKGNSFQTWLAYDISW